MDAIAYLWYSRIYPIAQILCRSSSAVAKRPRDVISINISISISFFSIAQTPTVRPRAHYIVIISCVIRSSMHGWKETFSVLSERQMSIMFFSVKSAAGSMRSVQRWKMLDRPFSGSSVGRHSLRDWRPAVRTGMKWQRLAAASPWCSLVIVRVMTCGRENSLYKTRSLIGSQCSSRRAQVMWSRWLRSNTTRAATRRTCCNGFRVRCQ